MDRDRVALPSRGARRCGGRSAARRRSPGQPAHYIAPLNSYDVSHSGFAAKRTFFPIGTELKRRMLSVGEPRDAKGESTQVAVTMPPQCPYGPVVVKSQHSCGHRTIKTSSLTRPGSGIEEGQDIDRKETMKKIFLASVALFGFAGAAAAADLPVARRRRLRSSRPFRCSPGPASTSA